MASSSPQPPSQYQVSVTLPHGPLGVTIQRKGANGQCVVTSKTAYSAGGPANPLEVKDVIVSLNGIILADVEGGMNAWMTLFQVFDGTGRNLVVQRVAAASTTAASSATDAAVVASANEHGAASAAAAAAVAPKFDLSTVLQRRRQETDCNFSSQQSIVDYFRNVPGKGKLRPMLSQIATLETEEAKAQYVRDWRNLTKEQQENYKKDVREGGNIVSISAFVAAADAAANDVMAASEEKKHALKDSSKHNATTTKKQKVEKKKSSKKKTDVKNNFTHDSHYLKLIEDGFPTYYGSVSPCQHYYICKTNDCYHSIADKVGLDDWKALNGVEFNTVLYGVLTANTQFQRGTIVKIPTIQCSKWKLSKMVDNHAEEMKMFATCSKCLKKEQPDDMDEMLLCDGCDLEMHTSCAGLTAIPERDWLCESCLEILDARKKNQAADCPKDDVGRRSLEAKLPPLPKLDVKTSRLAERAKKRFKEDTSSRKDAALSRLEENQRVLAEASKERVANLTSEVETLTPAVERDKRNYDNTKRRIFGKHGITGWNLQRIGRSHINFRRENGSIGTVYRYRGSYHETSPEWNRYHRKQQECHRELGESPEKVAYSNVKNQLASLKEDFNQALADEKDRPAADEEDRRNLLLEFVKLLSEPKLDFETQKSYQSRVGCDPVFLGVVKVEDPDVRVLNILREPTELVLSIPVVNSGIAIDVEPVEAGEEYYLFGKAELFSIERNDYTPMDFSPTSTRTAQRDLMAMLRRDPRNSSLQVSEPVIPSSVSLRGTSEEILGDITKCFDLSELVRDCHYPIQNQPAAETPKRLADNGLVLRDYQKTSLQWLLDKERNPTGMGSSGELWSRMRGITRGSSDTNSYFYCELTGSIVKDIFNYRSDVDQKDASKLCGDT
ncbi:hypothetical protein ACHAXR_005696, partial [Thalassiosira sp. AJA248-18]